MWGGNHGRKGARRIIAAFALGCCLAAACSGSGSSDPAGAAASGQAGDATGGTAGAAGDASAGSGASGGDTGVVTSRRVALTIPLYSETGPQGVMLKAGVPLRQVTTLELPDLGFHVVEASLDMTGTLSHVAFTPNNPGAAPVGEPELRASAWIAAGDASDPCASGEAYGPARAPVQNGSLTGTIEPATLDISPSSLSHVNEGLASACLELLSPIDAYVAVDGVELSVMLGIACDVPPEVLVGVWEGTYECEGSCGDESGAVRLEITQDGHQASYTDDFGCAYEGAVCGRAFAFVGGSAGELEGMVETGRFVAGPDGRTAPKESVWTNGFCWGLCYDTLTKM